MGGTLLRRCDKSGDDADAAEFRTLTMGLAQAIADAGDYLKFLVECDPAVRLPLANASLRVLTAVILDTVTTDPLRVTQIQRHMSTFVTSYRRIDAHERSQPSR